MIPPGQLGCLNNSREYTWGDHLEQGKHESHQPH